MNSGNNTVNHRNERVLTEVHRLLKAGRVNPALRLLEGILSTNPGHAAALACAADICLKVGHHQELNQELINAYKAYVRTLIYYPDQEEAQARLLELLPEYLKGTSTNGAHNDPGCTSPGKLILGIGTGRSGSTSLTMLLSMQHDTYVSHEHPPKLPWVQDPKRYRFHCDRLRKILAMKAHAGDVAHWWLPYLPDLLVRFPDARIICLQRDQEATVRSFEAIKGQGKGSVNHWISHNGSYWTHTPWDECYPDYSVKRRKLALTLYWDEYYATVSDLAREYPANIRIYDINRLDSIAGQEEMLEFCGYLDPVTKLPLKFNQGSIKDGIVLT